MPELVFLLKIGFLPIRIWDVLDVLIVGYLLYQLYKLLRGSIAFNIFIANKGWLLICLKYRINIFFINYIVWK